MASHTEPHYMLRRTIRFVANIVDRCFVMAFVLTTAAPSTVSALPLTNPSHKVMSQPLRRRFNQPAPNTTTSPTHSLPATRWPIKVITKAALEAPSRPKSRFSIFVGFHGAVAAIMLHLFTGTVFLKISEGWALLDALYFSVVIATTVGYGDITPVNPASKIFVSLYAIISVAIIAGMLQNVVERLSDAHGDIADTARNRLLRLPTADMSDGTHSNITDLVQSTRFEAEKARLQLRATLIMLMGVFISGALIYGRFLNASAIDLFYFLCVSMTTVGLGDIHPVTRLGKAYAAIWLVLTSLGFANIISQYTNLRAKQQQREMAQDILAEGVSDQVFNEIDGNGDGNLSEAEFLGYMLCKLGKASPDDVRQHSLLLTSLLPPSHIGQVQFTDLLLRCSAMLAVLLPKQVRSILQRFQELDRDGSGYITREEVDITVKKEV